jgi:uroporphyrinogen-III synthase
MDITAALAAYGYDIQSVIIYAAVPVCTPDKFGHIFRDTKIAAVTFFSARTAHVFLECLMACAKTDPAVQLEDIKFLCISDFVLKCVQEHAAGVHPENISVSDTPDTQGMMELIKRTCAPKR